MTIILKLDSKGRASFARLGGRPGQTFSATLDGPRIVLEPLSSENPDDDDWKPLLSLRQLMRHKVECVQTLRRENGFAR